MTPKGKEYLDAIKSLFDPVYHESDIFIKSQRSAKEAFNYLTRILAHYEVDVNHLYYIKNEYVRDKYYYTEYEEKEELVEYEPTYMEEFGNYPKYKKIYTRVPVERCVDNGGNYKEKLYKVERIILHMFPNPNSLEFRLENGSFIKRLFDKEDFTPFFIKTDSNGKTFFSQVEMD